MENPAEVEHMIDKSGFDSESSKFSVNDALAQQFEEIGEIGYFVFDALDEKFLYVSSGFARIYGVCPVQHRENIKSLEDDLAFILEEDREQVHAAYQKYLCLGKNCIVEYRIRRDDGSIRWIRESSAATRVKAGKVELTIGAIQDITEQKDTENKLLKTQLELEQKVFERTAELTEAIIELQNEVAERKRMAGELEFLANHDPLTGLASLRLCKERLEIAITRSRQNSRGCTVMFLDLDGFKVINDNHGHELGDQVLKLTAERIVSEIPKSDVLARIGGDEFVLILDGVSCRNSIRRIATRLNAKVSLPVYLDSQLINISASIGIAIYPDDGVTPKELIGQADKAMYQAKKAGKNGYKFSKSME